MTQDRTSWKVKDEAILEELIALIEITDQERAILYALAGEAREAVPVLTKAFYERLFKHANTAEYLEGVPHERLYNMAGQWFLDLFTGVYDKTYVQKRLTIGQVHVRIGLPVRYPLAMLDVLIEYGDVLAAKSAYPEQARSAIRKVLSLDIAIFNQAYEDTQLKHLAELAGSERLARRVLSGL